MAECIDIFRSIGASCNALNNVGGVNKRVWITQLSQVLNYTFDADGYLNTIELTSGNTLKTITGKKFSNSGTFEGVIGNAKLIKQNAILKIFYYNPTDKTSLETYIKAQQLVVFFETESKKIEVYGLEKGMTLSAIAGGTGANLQDESSALYTISGEQKSLPFYFKNGTFVDSIEYLNNLGIGAITSYSAGTSSITFEPDGSNGWNVGVIANPTTIQVPSGTTITSCDYEIKHYASGTSGGTNSGSLTTDDTINTGALGAGTYEISLIYHISNGDEVNTIYAYQVDATDGLIAYCKINGATVNSVSGLDVSVTADVNSSSVMNIDWYAYDGGSSFVQIGTGTSATLTVPIGTIYIVPVVTLGSDFPDYPSPELASHFSITIS